MPWLKVQIEKWIDDRYYPLIVQCVFIDANGQRHKFVEKAPVISMQDLTSFTEYPRTEYVECAVLSSGTETGDRTRIRLRWLESTAGLSEFEVVANQVFDHYPAEPGSESH